MKKTCNPHRHHRTRCLGLVLTAGAATSGARPVPRPARAGHDAQTPDAKEYQAAYLLVLEEKWEQAGPALDGVHQEVSVKRRGSWTPTTGLAMSWTRRRAGPEEAFKAYQEFVNSYPSSDWADEARANMIQDRPAPRRAGQTGIRGDHQGHREVGRRRGRPWPRSTPCAESGGESAVQTMIELYDQSKSSRMRSRIARVLGDFESPKAFQKLAEIVVKDPSPYVRFDALQAIAEKKNARSGPDPQGHRREGAEP